MSQAVRLRSRSLFGAWYGLVALFVVGQAAYLVRAVMVLVTEPFKATLGLSDTQIGALNGIALSLVAALATLPMGVLIDRVDRRLLLSACIVIWSLSTIGFGLADNFTMLFALAMGIAAAEAVLGPIGFSITPDMFPRELWVTVNYIGFLTSLLSQSLGLALSGATIAYAATIGRAVPAAAGLEPWRIALMLTSCAAPVLIVMVMLIPLRRRAAPTAQQSAPQGLLAFFRQHARALAGVFLGFGIVYAAYGVLTLWFAVALTRVFHVPPARVGVELGSVMLGAALAGVAVSAGLARWLRPKHGEFAPMIVAQLMVAGAVMVTPLLVIATTAWQAYAVGALIVLFITACLSISPSILQFLAPAHMRGRVIALGGLVSIVFSSLAPVVVGLVSDHVFPGRLIASVVTVSFPCFVVGLGLLRFGSARLPALLAAANPDTPLPAPVIDQGSHLVFAAAPEVAR